MNAGGHERHVRHDVHDRVFLHCQREHVRENARACVHGYGQLSREHVGGCAGADVRVSLAWGLRC